jgi:hypothetical protein
MFDATEDCSSYELCSGIAGLFCRNVDCDYHVFIISLLSNVELNLPALCTCYILFYQPKKTR